MAALVAHRNYLTDVLQRQSARRANVDPRGGYAPQPELSWRPQPESGPSATAKSRAAPQPQRDDDEQGHDEQVKSKANVVNYVPAQEALRNDYAAWYGVSGQFPSNFVLGAGDEEICEE
jgi:mRNA (2'-O-methyladenosine-N6-)-methyltransferase